MLRVVVDTNLWIRCLLGGVVTFPLLEAWRARRFEVVISAALLEELDEVRQRPRLRRHIDPQLAAELLDQLRWRSPLVDLRTIPPRCRDPKDHPVLATAIDGRAHAIVSGDGDLRADDQLRAEMAELGIEIWGIHRFLEALSESSEVPPRGED